MKKQQTVKAVPVDETLRIGLCLAFVGGFLDVYTYLLRGGVFANAQTGNLVLMGIGLAQGEFLKTLYCLVPVTAFFVGVLLTETLKHRFSSRAFLEWQHVVILVEIVLLFCVGFVPTWIPNAIVNVTISFICSMQTNSFRKTRGLPYATTMCTGNLRSSAEQCFRCCIQKDRQAGRNALRYLSVIGAFALGAVAGTLLCGLWDIRAIWVCCGVLAAALLMMVHRK
ncbi:MAG: DUF1275 domain-containing protein [Clostridiales bacterium]|nr:DUF1275 domain-containing protein [Clostridiales bacterium]